MEEYREVRRARDGYNGTMPLREAPPPAQARRASGASRLLLVLVLAWACAPLRAEETEAGKRDATLELFGPEARPVPTLDLSVSDDDVARLRAAPRTSSRQ